MEIEELKKSIESIFPLDKNGRYNLYLEKPVGYFEINFLEDKISLEMIFIEEEYRGKGLGNFLLNQIKSISELARLQVEGIDDCKIKDWYKNKGFVCRKNTITYFPKSLYAK